MKSYTDIEQSKKLAEILPLESADMEYMFLKKDNSKVSNVPFVKDDDEPEWPDDGSYNFIPCWSLTALLGVTRNYCIRFELTLRTNKKYNLFAMGDNFVYRGFNECPDGIDNPIDACYDMTIKLHEDKLL